LETVILLTDEPQIKKNYFPFFKQAFPADLKFALLWLTVNILAIYLPFLNETLIRDILILPVVLFIPGYCIVAALYPNDFDIDFLERILLSFGLSIALVPFIIIWLNFTQFEIRLDPILLALTVITLVMILIAHYRRALLPFNEQFKFPFFEVARTLRNVVFLKKGSRVDNLVAVILTFALIVTILATVYVIVVPKEGERFTEFFILGEKQKAADYPDQIIAGLYYTMFIGVGNHEYRNVNYTIETWLLRTEFDNVTNTSRIIAMDPNDHLSFTLTDNETTIIPYNLSVKRTGYDRVEFLLFNESLPGPDVKGNDRIKASYRDLYLRVNVKEADYQEFSDQGTIERTAVTLRDEASTEHLSSVTILSKPSAINAPQRLHTGQGLMAQHCGDFRAIALQPSMNW
jgi:uncharacterized membrane protein